MRKTTGLVPSVSDDFASADLGDKRLVRRLRRIVEAAERLPGASLPQRAGSSAALEAMYRFFANDRVTPEPLFESHVAATVRRAVAESDVLVLHDTTEFRFGGAKPRKGMGWLNSDSKQGFLAHFSVCATPDGQPLGTLALHAWVRQESRAKRRNAMPDLKDPDRESQRWTDAALTSAELLHNRTRFVHLMDREGDQFELFAMLVEHEQRFVIRLAHDRRLETGRGRTAGPMLFDSLGSCPFFFVRDVPISARVQRSGSKKAVFPARKSRIARLEVRAGQRKICRSHMAPSHAPLSLCLNVVEVREVDVPDGEASIVWRLVTTEPVCTEADVARVVDAYRQRWLIEEFFKALKTGCRYQELQLESLRSLLIALSIEVAVASKLLMLRWFAQHRPDANADSVLPAEDLQVLAALSVAETGRHLRTPIDACAALLELARLGGHIKNNGAPGWLVLRRGYDVLVAVRRGWRLAHGP